MSKKFKILVALIGSALMVTGCGKNGTNPIKNNDNTNQNDKGNDNNDDAGIPVDGDIIPIDQVVVEDDDDDGDGEFRTVTCEEINRGSSGGSLTDFFVGSCIEPQCSYKCTFSHDKNFSGAYTDKSDDRTIAQVTHEEGTNYFTVKGITQGDAIIQAYTDENELVLQFVAHVRNRIPMEKIPEKLYKNTTFHGMYYGYKLSFLSKDPLMGNLVGSDDFENTNANFKLTDGVEEKIANGTDFNTYKFRMVVDYETSVTNRTYTYLYVSTTGDKIYMYYTNGIIDIFTPNAVNIYAL